MKLQIHEMVYCWDYPRYTCAIGDAERLHKVPAREGFSIRETTRDDPFESDLRAKFGVWGIPGE